MRDLIANSAAERRFVLLLFETFALIALALAAVGIYGILSGDITDRTREIGVRSALGASRSNILALVLRQGMSLARLGIVIGLGIAMIVSRFLVTLLFGISQVDPITYSCVAILFLGVSASACCVPAWRALRIDPSITLRAE
jgi:ABC-type antimicrobial peptide transport system permease subunit